MVNTTHASWIQMQVQSDRKAGESLAQRAAVASHRGTRGCQECRRRSTALRRKTDKQESVIFTIGPFSVVLMPISVTKAYTDSSCCRDLEDTHPVQSLRLLGRLVVQSRRPNRPPVPGRRHLRRQ